MKDLLSQITMPGNRNLCPSRITINAFGKNTPGQSLRYGHSRREISGEFFHENPSSLFPEQEPLAAAFARNFDENCLANRRMDIPVEIRHSAEETIENWMIQIRSHNARSIRGEPDLLLVMPTLR